MGWLRHPERCGRAGPGAEREWRGWGGGTGAAQPALPDKRSGTEELFCCRAEACRTAQVR